MATPLKDMYSPGFLDALAKLLAELISGLDTGDFKNSVMDSDWESRELKDRIRQISTTLHGFLPLDFEDRAEIIRLIANRAKARNLGRYGFEFMFLPDYVEIFGLGYYSTSISLMEDLTQFVSCEFAVRPFIREYGNQMMYQMERWSRHNHEQVRRLSSEGCRPRLPWASALPDFKRDPTPVLPILENLKADPSDTVRISVANNINDISKDHPDLVRALVKNWKTLDLPETNWIVKHGCRTLLKQGDPEVMALFGFGPPRTLRVTGLYLDRTELTVGDKLPFQFNLENTGDSVQTVRLEYAIYFMRSNGTHYRKVFMIGEKIIGARKSIKVERKRSFQKITTRSYFPGEHHLGVIVNGHELAKASFVVTSDGSQD